MLDFNYIVTRLRVEDVAQEHGYTYIGESASNKWHVLEGPGGKMVINPRPKNILDFYFTPGDDKNKGNVINFAKAHLNLSGKDLGEFFEQKLGSAVYKSGSRPSDYTLQDEKKEFCLKEHGSRPLQQSDRMQSAVHYLKYKRSIPESVIFDQRFLPDTGVTVLNYKVQGLQNITSPLYQSDLEVKERKFVGLYKTGPGKKTETGQARSYKFFFPNSDRAVCLWQSSLPQNANKDFLIIAAESPIDAMRLYARDPEKLAKAVFVSPIGQVMESQIEQLKIINKVLSHRLGMVAIDHTNVITATDADDCGLMFSVKIKIQLPSDSFSKQGVGLALFCNNEEQKLIIQARTRKDTELMIGQVSNGLKLLNKTIFYDYKITAPMVGTNLVFDKRLQMQLSL